MATQLFKSSLVLTLLGACLLFFNNPQETNHQILKIIESSTLTRPATGDSLIAPSSSAAISSHYVESNASLRQAL